MIISFRACPFLGAGFFVFESMKELFICCLNGRLRPVMRKITKVFNSVRTTLLFLVILASIVIVESVCHANLSVENHSISSKHFVVEAALVLFALLLVGFMYDWKNRQLKAAGKSAAEFEKFCFDNVLGQQLFNKLNDLILITDPSGKILCVNSVTCDFLGYEKDEIEKMNIGNLICSDNRKPFRNVIEQVSQGVEISPRDIRLLRKSGGYIDVEVKGVPLHAKADGGYIGVIFRSIMDYKKNEILLQVQDEWEKMFDSIGDFVSIHDKNYKIIKANSALCDFLEKDPDEIVGKSCCQIFHGRSEPHQNCPHRKAAETGHDVSEVVDDADNEGIPLRITCSPLFHDNGEFSGTVHIARLYEEGIKVKNGYCEVIPICAACKSIRVKKDSWVTPEEYFSQKHLRQFTHGICTSCQERLYKDFL